MKKKFLVIIPFCLLMLVFLSVNIYAENIDEVYLDDLSLSEEGITPSFSKYITDYYISIPLSVKELKIDTKTNSSNKIEITGNLDLKEGNNYIKIIVTSPTNKQKEYNIVAVKSDNFDETNSFLEELVVDNFPLTPNFNSAKFEYSLGNIGEEVTKFDIIPIAKNLNEKIEIIGNSELSDGENEVKIIVTSADKKNTSEYILKYSKNKGVEEKEIISEGGENPGIQPEINEDEIKDKVNTLNKLQFIIVVVILIIIVTLIIFIIKNKVKK